MNGVLVIEYSVGLGRFGKEVSLSASVPSAGALLLVDHGPHAWPYTAVESTITSAMINKSFPAMWLPEVRKRILRDAVLPYFKVEMGACCTAGIAHPGDDLPLFYLLPLFYEGL